MNDRYLDDYLPVIAIDVAVEEKTRIAEMAAATLRKLHNVMRQMKSWRDDSARLKSNIWRMKMALRADDKNENDSRGLDPLIVHQRAEISRLEHANDALGNEVESLKRALTRAQEEDHAGAGARETGDEIAATEDGPKADEKREEERRSSEIPRRKQRRSAEETEESRGTRLVLRLLGDRLEELARGDRAFEAVLATAIGKVVETVVNLSEQLVNVHEDLYRFRTKNGNLRRKLDRLRAMLRSRSGNRAEYRKRIDELKNLAERLTGEMGRLKTIRGEDGHSNGADMIPDVIGHVGRLMSDLRSSLKSEREAMIAAGDPDRLRYMRKVVDLKVHLRVLAVELRRSSCSPSLSPTRPNPARNCHQDDERCAKTVSLLSDFLTQIDTEIGKLKVTPMDKYCRIGGVSGSRYARKVAELEAMAKRPAAVIAALRRGRPTDTADTGRERAMEELGGSVERLCREIKGLEVFDDRAGLRERIGRLEISIVRLRLELTERSERVNALNDERARARSTLERERDKHAGTVAELRRENERLREEADGRERRLAAETRPMTGEIDALGRKLRELRDDRETLSGEAGRLREILRERDKEIASVIAERESLGAALGAELRNLRTELGVASDENVKLRSAIEELGRRERERPTDKSQSSASRSDDSAAAAAAAEERRDDDDDDEGRPREDRARNLRDEPERSRADSNESEARLNGRQIDRLKRALDEALGDRARLQAEVSVLRSNEESLTYRSNVRTTSGREEAAREHGRRLTEANEASGAEIEQLRNGREQLEVELSELRAEKGQLAKSMDDAEGERAALRDQVSGLRRELDRLREEASEREATAGGLGLELKEARAGLEDARVQVARLRLEDSRLAGDLDALAAARCAEADGRVRVLLTERNELATRINELDDECAGLRDRLNKARAENEYFSMELNKSGVENDKVEAKNVPLQVTCDMRASENAEPRRERDDEAVRRLNEIGGARGLRRRRRAAVGAEGHEEAARRRITAVALYRGNNEPESHSKGIDTRYPLAKGRRERRGFADAHNELRHRKQDCSDAARTGVKVEIARQKDDETAFKAESDTRAGPDNKAGIKDKPKGGGLKRPRTENKALKLEPASSGPGYVAYVAMEPAARAEDESKSPILPDGGEPGETEEGIVDSVPPRRRRELANIRRVRRMSNYVGHSGDSKTFGDKEGSQVSDIDQLEVENGARRTEVDVPRGVLDFGLPTNDGDRTRSDLAKATEEIRALKSELMCLRDERAASRSRLAVFEEELGGLQSERAALKDELVAARRSNFDLRLKANDLRGAVGKLKETNARLEYGLRNALRETNERGALSEALDSSSGSLANIFRNISHAGENLRAIKKRLNRFERVPAKNPGLQSTQEDLQHMEGQK